MLKVSILNRRTDENFIRTYLLNPNKQAYSRQHNDQLLNDLPEALLYNLLKYNRSIS